jgi:hypothetical protein
MLRQPHPPWLDLPSDTGGWVQKSNLVKIRDYCRRWCP